MSRLYFYILSLLLIVLALADSEYNERLVLEPLPQGSLLASFNFRSNASLTSFEQQHFRYIPRSLGQILQHAKTKELHLRFSSGRWDAESWGARPWGGVKEGGTGVELWAWVEADTDEEYKVLLYLGSFSDLDQSVFPVDNSKPCSLWPLLRFSQLHRLNTDNSAIDCL